MTAAFPLLSEIRIRNLAQTRSVRYLWQQKYSKIGNKMWSTLAVWSIKYTVHLMKQAFSCHQFAPCKVGAFILHFSLRFNQGCCSTLMKSMLWYGGSAPAAHLWQKGQEVTEEYGCKKCQRKCQTAGLRERLAGPIPSYTGGHFRAKLPCAIRHWGAWTALKTCLASSLQNMAGT